jgi:hypothetical protein
MTSALGHQRRFERAPATAALPPIPDVLLSRSKRRSGPQTDNGRGAIVVGALDTDSMHRTVVLWPQSPSAAQFQTLEEHR